MGYKTMGFTAWSHSAQIRVSTSRSGVMESRGSALTTLSLARSPSGKRDATTLRIFLLDYAACRQSLTLKRGPLSWNLIGVQSKVPMNKALSKWEDCLQKHSFVLAVEEYKCPLFAKRMQVVRKKTTHLKSPWWWMPYIAAMGEEALDAVLEEINGATRLADIVRELRRAGKPFWSTRFVYGKAVENQVALEEEDGLLHQRAVEIAVRNKTKLEICNEFERLRGIGRFYAQHGVIMMSQGGQSSVLSRKGVQSCQSSVTLGDGALRILGLLASERGSPPDVRWSAANSEWITETLLREREAFCRLAEVRFADHPELIPAPLRRRRKSGQWHYEYIPETFGDLLCEWSQLLNALVTHGNSKHRTKTWRNFCRWPPSIGSKGERKTRKTVLKKWQVEESGGSHFGFCLIHSQCSSACLFGKTVA